MDEALTQAIKKVGGYHAVARALKIAPQSVWAWKRTPALRVLELERISGVNRRKLRPDIYPDR
jgi:DNA-binding transcriptional regulator YdaS (Cro superfamily)